MRRKLVILFLVLCLIIAALDWIGIGVSGSSSAVLDLKAELESIYGTEYTGKPVEEGTEDMSFVVEPKTWFMTNWNLRNAMCLDYEYECEVLFVTMKEDGSKIIRTITYQAVDPMGAENAMVRAHLDLDSKVEKTVRM